MLMVAAHVTVYKAIVWMQYVILILANVLASPQPLACTVKFVRMGSTPVMKCANLVDAIAKVLLMAAVTPTLVNATV